MPYYKHIHTIAASKLFSFKKQVQAYEKYALNGTQITNTKTNGFISTSVSI